MTSPAHEPIRASRGSLRDGFQQPPHQPIVGLPARRTRGRWPACSVPHRSRDGTSWEHNAKLLAPPPAVCPVEEAASVIRPIWDLAVAVEVVAVRVGAVRGRLSADVGLRDRFPESCGHVATDLELWRGARRSRGCVVRAGCGGGPRLRAAGRRRSRSRSCSGGAGSAGWSRHRGGVRGGGRVGGVGAADHDELCGEWPEVLDLVHGAAGVARGRAVDPAVGDRDAGSSSSGGLRRWSGRRPPLLAGSPRGRVSYQGTSDRWRAERCCSPVGCVGVPVASLTSLGKVGWVLSRTRRRNASSATTACSWAARNGA